MKIETKPIGDPKEWKKQFAEATKQLGENALEILKEQFNDALQAIECPEHHEHPHVEIVETDQGRHLEFNGCCEACKDEAKRQYQDFLDQDNRNWGSRQP